MTFFNSVYLRNKANTKEVNITDPEGDGLGGLDVFIQDQTTGTIDLKLMNVAASFTIAVNTTIDTSTFTATGGHGISVGDTIFIAEGERYSQFIVLNVATNVITIDMPLDFAYTTAATCTRGSTNMAVIGSLGSPVVFEIGPIGTQNWDIIRIMFAIEGDAAMDSALFGCITALTNGIVLRQKNSVFYNQFNAKSNADFALRAYDISYDDRAGAGPSGIFGFRCRRTFGGASKTGVTIRLIGSPEKIQVLIQDDLATAVGGNQITKMEAVVQGHIVE
jgi:hypothetical protein